MGGRGGSSGISIRAAKPKYFGESEKAVQLKITVTDKDLDESKSRLVWVPKSQLAEDGKPSNWITSQKAQEFYSRDRALSQFDVKWSDKRGDSFGPTQTSSERLRAEKAAERYKSGVASYNELLTKAKSMGIKGVRKGLKRATLEDMIRKAKKKTAPT